MLNTNQQKAADLVLEGSNVCISGSGGCGKSYLLNFLKDLLKGSAIFVAPTGKAALNIGGSTCHSVFGLPLGFPTDTELKKLSYKTKKLFKDDTIKTIFVDEVFMLRVDAFWAMDVKLRKIKKVDKPFGGLQIVVVGDMFQLESVLKEGTKEEQLVLSKFGGKYPFHSDSWEEADFKYVILDKMERTQDMEFKDKLEDIRFGRNLPKAVPWFNNKCFTRNIPQDSLRIVTTNKKAEEVNYKHYVSNPEPEFIFTASYWGKFNQSELPAPVTIKLKKGLKVILTANDTNHTYKNGSTGMVTGLNQKEILVSLDNGDTVKVEPFKWDKRDYEVVDGQLEQVVIGEFQQYPVLQANALTVHRVQGSTLEEAAIDLGWKAFAAGQAYVSVSRLTNVENLYLVRPLKSQDIIVNEDVECFYREVVNKTV